MHGYKRIHVQGCLTVENNRHFFVEQEGHSLRHAGQGGNTGTGINDPDPEAKRQAALAGYTRTSVRTRTR